MMKKLIKKVKAFFGSKHLSDKERRLRQSSKIQWEKILERLK